MENASTRKAGIGQVAKTIFFALLAVAVARLPETQRDTLLALFHALANAMLTLIGWVLWLAPPHTATLSSMTAIF